MSGRRIPRLYAAASLKHATAIAAPVAEEPGIPRLYAAASLKRIRHLPRYFNDLRYSAALCRGLIEAPPMRPSIRDNRVYSAALCRGLIEAQSSGGSGAFAAIVFRGSMPRPH